MPNVSNRLILSRQHLVIFTIVDYNIEFYTSHRFCDGDVQFRLLAKLALYLFELEF